MAGVVGKISCSKVRDLLRFPDFDDSNYLEKKKKSVSFTLQRSQEMMNQPGDLALHQHQWATLIFSSNEGQSLHRRSGWDLKAPVLVVPRVALARLAMENEKNKKPSAIKPNQQSAKKRLTLKDGALSTPGSATGTISSPIDLSNVKLSLGSNPFAVMSTETSIIGSSSYGSGRGGGGSCKRSGSGEDGWEVSQFWIACSRSCSHSSYRSIARSDSLLKSKMSTIRKRRRKTKLTLYVALYNYSDTLQTLPD